MATKELKWKNEFYFADIETYSTKYFQKNNRIKAYALLIKGYDNNYELFDIDTKSWLKTMYDDLSEQIYTKHNIRQHNGGKFDTNFQLPLIFELFDDKVQKEYTVNKPDTKTFKNISHRYVYKTSIDTLVFKKKTFSIKIITSLSRVSLKTRISTNEEEFSTNHTNISEITFLDSYTIWSSSLAQLGKAVNMAKLDYEEYDFLDEFRTKEDYINWKSGKPYEYLHRDVDILIAFAKSTEDIIPLNEYSLTLASTSKKLAFKSNPMLKGSFTWLTGNHKVWQEVKKAYNGGFTIANKAHQLKVLHNVVGYDVNSLYPYIMRHKALPYGKPLEDLSLIDHPLFEDYTYHIYEVTIHHAKTDGVPFIHKSQYEEVIDVMFNEIEEDIEEVVYEYNQEIDYQVIYMDSHLFKLFETYYTGEWTKTLKAAFKERYGMFDNFIDYFIKLKQEYDDNPAKRLLIKLILNSLYGKFGQSYQNDPTIIRIMKEINEDYEIKETEKAKYVILKDGRKRRLVVNENIGYFEEHYEPEDKISYIPIAAAITSQARKLLVDAANLAGWENIVYMDTDSIKSLIPLDHLLNIHQTELGAWKNEGTYDNFIVRRTKHYTQWNNQCKLNWSNRNTDKWKNKSFEIKGGGFNVSDFDYNNLPPTKYIQSDFEVEYGKKISLLVNGGTLIVAKGYKFSMPKYWYAENDKHRYNTSKK